MKRIDPIRSRFLLFFTGIMLSLALGCAPRGTGIPREGQISRLDSGIVDRTEVIENLVGSATDAERILGIQWAMQSEMDKPEQMTLFLSILSSIYHSDALGDDLDWTALRPNMKPLLEQAMQRWPMQEGRVYIHGLAAKMTAAMEIRELIPELRLLMIRERGHARRYAIEALGRLNDPQSVPSLKQMVRVMAVPGEMGGGQDFSTMIYAAQALHRMGDDSGMEYIRQFLTFPSATIQAQMAVALAEKGDDSVIPYLIEGLDHPSVFPIPVLEALSHFQTREVAQALANQMESEDTRVRRIAALTLARQGDRRARSVLLTEAQSDDVETAFLALLALSVLEDSRVPEIMKRVYPKVSKARMVAAGAVLASLGDQEGAALLTHLMRDREWAYRAAASAMVLLFVQQ